MRLGKEGPSLYTSQPINNIQPYHYSKHYVLSSTIEFWPDWELNPGLLDIYQVLSLLSYLAVKDDIWSRGLRMIICPETAQRSMILAVPVSMCSLCHLANYLDTWGEPSEDRGTEDDPSYTGLWMQSGVVKCQIIPYFIFLCSEWLPRPGARAPPPPAYLYV